MSDLLFQNLSTVQSNQQATPVSLDIAAVIAPTTFLTLLVGSTTQTVATITPPTSGLCVIALQSTITNALTNSVTTVGGITGTLTMTANNPALLVYNPVSKLWQKVI